MVESQVTCDNYRCHEYGSKMQRNVFYEDDDEMEYFSCNKCRNTTTPQIVEIEMGNCYMCDKPAVFIAHDLPTGEKPFCSELHFCQYARLSYHGEGYYGFTDPTKVKEPARLARARKRLKYAESFSAEKVKKEILEDDDSGLVMKFIYKDREGKLEWSDNEDGKGGVLSFGDNPFKPYDPKIGRRMSRLPHSQKIEDIRSKLEAKEVFKIMMDKPCQSCGDAINKKGIGSCGWCEDDYTMNMKFDPTKDINDNKWWDRQSEKRKIFLWNDVIFKNPYCRDCLYYYGLGKNYPSAFDKESANYYLANAVCEKHWDEIVAEGGLSKDTKRNSLYEIENVSPRERMMKQRFGFGSETFEADTNQWKVGDKVKILNNGGGNEFNIGEIVTITMVDYGGTYLSVNGNGAEWTISESNGILVGEEKKYIPKYKVGDMVFGDGGRVRILIIGVDEDNGAYHRFTESGEIVKMDIKNLDSNSDFQLYVPKYKVGDILINRMSRYKAIIVDYTSFKGEYHWKYLEGGGKGIFIDTHFEVLDTDIDYELYLPPKTNPRIARLKKRFGFGAENDYVKTGVASLAIITLLGLTLFKRD